MWLVSIYERHSALLQYKKLHEMCWEEEILRLLLADIGKENLPSLLRLNCFHIHGKKDKEGNVPPWCPDGEPLKMPRPHSEGRPETLFTSCSCKVFLPSALYFNVFFFLMFHFSSQKSRTLKSLYPVACFPGLGNDSDFLWSKWMFWFL